MFHRMERSDEEISRDRRHVRGMKRERGHMRRMKQNDRCDRPERDLDGDVCGEAAEATKFDATPSVIHLHDRDRLGALPQAAPTNLPKPIVPAVVGD
jgi:hypothetical protein